MGGADAAAHLAVAMERTTAWMRDADGGGAEAVGGQLRACTRHESRRAGKRALVSMCVCVRARVRAFDAESEKTVCAEMSFETISSVHWLRSLTDQPFRMAFHEADQSHHWRVQKQQQFVLETRKSFRRHWATAPLQNSNLIRKVIISEKLLAFCSHTRLGSPLSRCPAISNADGVPLEVPLLGEGTGIILPGKGGSNFGRGCRKHNYWMGMQFR